MIKSISQSKEEEIARKERVAISMLNEVAEYHGESIILAYRDSYGEKTAHVVGEATDDEIEKVLVVLDLV